MPRRHADDQNIAFSDGHRSSDGLLHGYMAHVRAVEGKALRTADSYGRDVKLYLQFLSDDANSPPADLATEETIIGYLIDQERRGLSAATRRRAVFALRSFYRWLGNPDHTNPAVKVRPPGSTLPRAEFYTDAQADRILDHVRDTPGLRARVADAVLATFRYAGLRNTELISLRMHEIDPDARRLQIRGKGSKERLVPIPPVLAEILRHYIDDVRPRLPESRHLFVNPNSQPRGQWAGRFSTWTMDRLVRELTEGAGVPGRHHPHRWRHTYATALLRGGADIHTVQRLLGHASIQTTLRYLHLVDDDLRADVDRVFRSADD